MVNRDIIAPSVARPDQTATFVGYSEWRPTRWRLTLSTGRRYGLFTSHAKAARFADGVLMDFDENDTVYASITCVRSASHFKWQGDCIGLGDGPAIVTLRDEFGGLHDLSVAAVLLRASEIDPYGLGRVVSALRLMADLEELHPDDLAAWREVEDQFPVFQRGEVL